MEKSQQSYSTSEAAYLMGITPDLLRHYLREEKIPGAIKRGGTRWLVSRKDIDDYLGGRLDLSGTFRNWRNKYRKQSKWAE